MNIWDKLTGADMTRDFKAMKARVSELPRDMQSAWEGISEHLALYGDFSGRNLMPIFENVLSLLEVSSADAQSADEVFAGDIEGFCRTLTDIEGVKSYRDKWRDELNGNVAKKLRKAGY